jgi:NAD+ kinase
MEFETIAFVASDQDAATEAKKRLSARYDDVAPDQADIIVALGGDGLMLQTLHGFMEQRIPIFGLNRGSVGFLMNEYRENDLIERLQRAEPIDLHPLRMTALDVHGREHEALAINEVSLLRQTHLTAKIRIEVDGVVRMKEMVGDGILVATPAGSTAYNNAVYGPIIPLGTDLLALTPISAFRPRRWRGALLPHGANVTFEIIDPRVRPVSAVADFTEVRHVARIDVREDRAVGPTLLFDPEHNLAERVVKEQFVV